MNFFTNFEAITATTSNKILVVKFRQFCVETDVQG
jgi:hypothetical protein